VYLRECIPQKIPREQANLCGAKRREAAHKSETAIGKKTLLFSTMGPDCCSILAALCQAQIGLFQAHFLRYTFQPIPNIFLGAVLCFKVFLSSGFVFIGQTVPTLIPFTHLQVRANGVSVFGVRRKPDSP